MLRVVTYNAHDCIGRDGAYAPDRIASIVAGLGADVVALQEITLDHAGDVVTLLESATGMYTIDGTLFERGVGRYGNLLLSRRRVAAQALHDLSFAGREPRGLIEVDIAADGLLCRVFATHLGLASRERHQQISKIAALISALSGPAILMGDFNDWLSLAGFSPLKGIGFVPTTIPSYPTWWRPFIALDRVLVRQPARIIGSWREGGSLAGIASDHFPIVVDIEIGHRQVAAEPGSS